MSKNTDNNQIVSFRLIRSTDGIFKITKREAMNRTKRMIAFDKELDWDEVTVGKNLEDDLGYKEGEKKDLGKLIENIFFRDVNATVDSRDLVKATTVRDLYEIIWSNYIFHDEISTKEKNRSIRKSLKITKEKTLDITRKMIAFDKNRNVNEIEKMTKLKDLSYEDKKEIMQLTGWIKKDKYFGKYIYSEIDDSKLSKAKIVQDVSDIIWKNYIRNEYKEK